MIYSKQGVQPPTSPPSRVFHKSGVCFLPGDGGYLSPQDTGMNIILTTTVSALFLRDPRPIGKGGVGGGSREGVVAVLSVSCCGARRVVDGGGPCVRRSPSTYMTLVGI